MIKRGREEEVKRGSKNGRKEDDNKRDFFVRADCIRKTFKCLTVASIHPSPVNVMTCLAGKFFDSPVACGRGLVVIVIYSVYRVD